MNKVVFLILICMCFTGFAQDLKTTIDAKVRNVTLNSGKVADVLQATADRIQPIDVSGTDTYTVSITSVTAYGPQQFCLNFANTNTTTVTLQINTLGAKHIKKLSGGSWVDLTVGDLSKGIHNVAYDVGNDIFQLLGGTISGTTAGGDLSGTYPNPMVAKINGNTVPSNASGALANDGSGNLSWGIPSIAVGDLQAIAGRSVVGNFGTSSAAPSVTTASSADQILRVNTAGTTIQFGSINLASGLAVGTSVLGQSNGGAGLVNGLLKANGSGVVSQAIAGTDYGDMFLSSAQTSTGKKTFQSNATNAGLNVGTAFNPSSTVNGDIWYGTNNFINIQQGGSVAGIVTATTSTNNKVPYWGGPNQLYTDGNLGYNPGTGTFSATTFSGSGASLTGIPTTGISGWPSNSSGSLINDGSGNLSWGSAGSVANALTVDNASLQLNSGTTFDGSAAKTISVKNLGITNAMIANSTIDLTTKVTGLLPDGNISSSSSWNAKESALTFSTGLTRTTNTITVNTSQNIAKLSNLTSNGFVKTSGSDGTLSIDASTYLTGNQTITLSGDVTGSGTTAITTAIGASKVTNTMLAGSIASSKLIGTDIATVGTITSGTWQGTAIGDSYISSASTWNAKQASLNYYVVTTISALQTYLSGLASNSEVNLFFPPGSYNVSSAITITSMGNVDIIGYGATLTNTFSGAGNIFAITTVKTINIKGLTIDLANNSQQVDGININGVTQDSRITDLTVKNFGNSLQAGLRLQNVPSASANGQDFNEPGLTITGCNFKNTVNYSTYDYNSNNSIGIGIYMTDVVEYYKIVNSSFINLNVGAWLINGANGLVTNCQFNHNLPRISSVNYGAIYIDNGGTNGGKLAITNCTFNHNWGFSIWDNYSTAIRPLEIDHCSFRANAITAIVINSTSSFNRISTCTFDRANQSSIASNNPYSAVVSRYVYLNNSSNNIVENNTFLTGLANSGTYVVTLGTSTNNVIRNNIYQSGTELLSLANTGDMVFGNNTGQSEYTTTATAAGTTTLTSASSYFQTFTGSTTQTVKLPVVTTLNNSKSFRITNNSTGIVTVQSSGANTIQALASNTSLEIWVINVSGGTGTASWNWIYNNLSIANNPIFTSPIFLAGTSTSAAFGLTSGTDLSSPTAGKFYYNGTRLGFSPSTTIKRVGLTNDVAPSNGQIGIGNGTDYTVANITGSNGVSVANGSGTIALSGTSTVIGVTDGSNATAGNLGEVPTSNVSTYTNYTTSATYQAITSKTLTAGDYLIWATVTFSSNSATLTGAANAIFCISTTSASAAGTVEGKSIVYVAEGALLSSSLETVPIQPFEVSISGSTTYYLNTQASFTIGNPQFVGSIYALRIR